MFRTIFCAVPAVIRVEPANASAPVSTKRSVGEKQEYWKDSCCDDFFPNALSFGNCDGIVDAFDEWTLSVACDSNCLQRRRFVMTISVLGIVLEQAFMSWKRLECLRIASFLSTFLFVWRKIKTLWKVLTRGFYSAGVQKELERSSTHLTTNATRVVDSA